MRCKERHGVARRSADDGDDDVTLLCVRLREMGDTGGLALCVHDIMEQRRKMGVISSAPTPRIGLDENWA